MADPASSDPSLSLDVIELLPFAAQRDLIAWACLQPTPPGPLLLRLSPSPDHEPLLCLVRGLIAGGRLPDLFGDLSECVCSLADTGVSRLLTALTDANLSPSVLLGLCNALSKALETLPFERLQARGLLERWLRRHDPSAPQAAATAARCRIEAALGLDVDTDAALAQISDLDLLALSGRALAAIQPPSRLKAQWSARVAAWSQRVLKTLQSAPRSLSQAFAETLLSKRIYTDPAHCLHELLQNAEDANATTLRFTFTPAALQVEHDGDPFDARDVVGLLSVGQSTKRPGQLGMFGVGFKSVYALCDRPQLYSPFFCFEIADVSIPKPLQPPVDLSPGWTRLVLPWRVPLDVSMGAIAEAALSLPAELLLTLRNLCSIEVQSPQVLRTIARERLSKSDSPDGVDDVCLGDGGRVTRYVVVEGRGGVRVAVEVGAGGEVRARAESVANLFCFFPTRERAPLRVLVHAPFDVPVDRERVHLESARNVTLFGYAGEALARLVAHTGAFHLLVLPSARDHGVFHGLMAKVRERLEGMALWDVGGGRRVRADGGVWLRDGGLRALLGGEEVGGEGRVAVVGGVRDGDVGVLVWLGMWVWSVGDLVRWLRGSVEGAKRLVGRVGAGRLLGAFAECREIDGVADCVIFPDQKGNLYALKEEGFWLPSGVAALDGVVDGIGGGLFGGRFGLLDGELAKRLGGWLERLGGRRWSVGALVQMLSGVRPSQDELPRLYACLASLKDHLTHMDRQALTRLVLWPDVEGVLRPLERLRGEGSPPGLEVLVGMLGVERVLISGVGRGLVEGLGLGGALWVPDVGWLVGALEGAFGGGARGLERGEVLRLLAEVLEASGFGEVQRRGWRGRLSQIRLWPGEAASAVIDMSVLTDIAPLAVWEALGGWSRVEGEHFVTLAVRLADWFAFLDPRLLLVRFAERGLGRDVETCLKLLQKLAGWPGLEALPLGVTVRGDIIKPPLQDAEGVPEGIVGELGRLAHPRWAAGVRALGLGKGFLVGVEARRVTLGLMQAASDGERAAGLPWLADEGRRQALYGWLLAHWEEIARDEQTMGTLGKAHIVRTRGGRFVAPSMLLVLGEGLALELGEFWVEQPEEGCPAALIEGFDRQYRLVAKCRERLIGVWAERLLEASRGEEAERAVLAVLDGVPFGVPLTQDEARRHGLHRLKLLAADGVWQRAHRLIQPATAEARRWLLGAGVAVLSGALAVRLGEWAEVFGVKDRVKAEVLEGWLKDLGRAQEGDQAWCRTLYVAHLASDVVGLVDVLRLRERAWIPDERGEYRAPGRMVLSTQHPLRGVQYTIHPTWKAEAPPALLDRLPFAVETKVETKKEENKTTNQPQTATAPPEAEEKPTRWWHRLLSKKPPEIGPPTTPPTDATHAPERPDDSAWFRDRTEIRAQLRASVDWLEDRRRPPRYGFAFAPPALPKPYTYAPQLIAPHFDARTQRWLPDASAWEDAWLSPSQSADAEPFKVIGRGQLPEGSGTFPMPLYGWAQAPGVGRMVREAGIWRADDVRAGEWDVAWHLGAFPEPTSQPIAAFASPKLAAWLAPTVPDAELPRAALSWLSTLNTLHPWERAKAIEAQIRARYAYDPSYLESDAHAQRLRMAAQGKTSAHLAALHAGEGGGFWGRGVCYELNALAVEWLRRVGIPAAFCVGWTLERGALSEPDHAWALALLPTVEGLRVWPMDGSSTRDGRPLRVAHRPAGPWHIDPPPISLPMPLPQSRPSSSALSSPPASQSPSKPLSKSASKPSQMSASAPPKSEPHPSQQSKQPQQTNPADLEAIARALALLAKAAHLPAQDWRAIARVLLRSPQTLHALLAALRDQDTDKT